MNTNRIRCNTRSAVAQMAAANHVPYRSGIASAVMELDGFVYFWAA